MAHAPQAEKIYVVKPPVGRYHESLWEIAQKYLGDGRRYRDIFELNKDRVQPDGSRLTIASLIRPGWILQMPGDAHGAGIEVVTEQAAGTAEPAVQAAPGLGHGSQQGAGVLAPPSVHATARSGRPGGAGSGGGTGLGRTPPGRARAGQAIASGAARAVAAATAPDGQAVPPAAGHATVPSRPGRRGREHRAWYHRRPRWGRDYCVRDYCARDHRRWQWGRGQHYRGQRRRAQSAGPRLQLPP